LRKAARIIAIAAGISPDRGEQAQIKTAKQKIADVRRIVS
jgi:hypothetical protein